MVLQIKQVSPRASVVTEKSFWTEHMKVARDYNTTVKTGATDLGKTLLDQIAKRNVCVCNKINKTSNNSVEFILPVSC